MPATWSYDADAGLVTLEGQGAFLGLAKAHNNGQLDAPYEAPASITYNVYLEEDGSLTVSVDYQEGWWTYKMVRD